MIFIWFTYVGITSYPGGVVSVSLNKMLYGTFLKFLCKPDLVVKKALGGSWSEKQLYRLQKILRMVLKLFLAVILFLV